jgi:isoleucyl-tRNA synthetase
MSPFTPFLTEAMYQNLRRALPPGAPESVHWCDIPEARKVRGPSPGGGAGGFFGGRRGTPICGTLAGRAMPIAAPQAPPNPARTRALTRTLTSPLPTTPPPPPQTQAHEGDARIEASVSRMQRVIELGRVIRERQNKPLKTPLARLVVVAADPEFLADIEGEGVGGGLGVGGIRGGACVRGAWPWRPAAARASRPQPARTARTA